MKTAGHLRTTWFQRALAWFLLMGSAVTLTGAGASDEEIAAVSSRVSSDYVRARQPNGSFQPEAYAFGEGGYWSGSIRDRTIDGMKFMDIARTLAGPLERQNYLPARDAKTTRLLIMVYWGTTEAPEHGASTTSFQNAAAANSNLGAAKLVAQGSPTSGNKIALGDAEAALTASIAMLQAENSIRDRTNRRNAAMLGYDSWWEETQGLENTALSGRREDLIRELEEGRYFVVLMAYDFQLMWKEKKTKLLWETRFSIGERHNQFDRQLAAMAATAAPYFGRDSHGLLHNAVPEGHVEVGELKTVETPAPEKSP